MNDATAKAQANRELIVDAQSRGLGPTLAAYTKLSGPGWLQSAITLGGGSLSGALFLGVLGGVDFLWLQLLAIICGVIMLSAISYVTLSTGERPFQAINEHINPVLGWGWIIATVLANIIWCMPQFGLSFEALQKNLVPGGLGDTDATKLSVSLVLLVAATMIVVMNRKQGATAKFFDYFLKALVGIVVICFFGVVIYLGIKGYLNWGQIAAGFIPDLSQWNAPTGRLAEILPTVSEPSRAFWTEQIVQNQRNVMIGAAATAVGINMTFLLPYSMINRGWDKPFRGLARFDLCTGMAIPYILVTSCVVIAAASAFHGKADEKFLHSDPEVMMQSSVFGGAQSALAARLSERLGDMSGLSNEEISKQVAAAAVELPESEKQLAAALVKRNAFQLSESLAPLLGEGTAKLVFGLGVFGMGFSTIIILMLINGYAFCEMFGQPQDSPMYIVGCLVSGVSGALWPLVWSGDSRFWLTILASTFGMMLLPIAYFTFLLMMNSKSLMGDEKPTPGKMLIWNVLMVFALLGAVVGAGSAIYTKAGDPKAGTVVIVMAVVYLLAVAVGFVMKKQPSAA